MRDLHTAITIVLHDRSRACGGFGDLVRFVGALRDELAAAIGTRKEKVVVEREARLRLGAALIQVRRADEGVYEELVGTLLNGGNKRTLDSVVLVAERYATADGRLDVRKAAADQELAKARRGLTGRIAEMDPEGLSFHDLRKLTGNTQPTGERGYPGIGARDEFGENTQSRGERGYPGICVGEEFGGGDDGSGGEWPEDDELGGGGELVGVGVGEVRFEVGGGIGPVTVEGTPPGRAEPRGGAAGVVGVVRHEQLRLDGLYAGVERVRAGMLTAMREAMEDGAMAGRLAAMVGRWEEELAGLRGDGGEGGGA